MKDVLGREINVQDEIVWPRTFELGLHLARGVVLLVGTDQVIVRDQNDMELVLWHPDKKVAVIPATGWEQLTEEGDTRAEVRLTTRKGSAGFTTKQVHFISGTMALARYELSEALKDHTFPYLVERVVDEHLRGM